MMPQKGAVTSLAFSASKQLYKIKTHHSAISIDTFARLTRHVLETSYFALDGKYYKQIKGGAMGSAVTQVLADIYMYEWEKDFLAIQTTEKQLYLRFRDDVFLTTELSHDQIEQRLLFYNDKDTNIKLTYEIGNTANYLDVTILKRTPRPRTTICSTI
ncbi:unnamed protein product [Didymodactylos carnosus]|uniref:Reverse transcriptase domain-containing protein n=1 Tax=Didymodactylos carnosus TaxID=1234261 RepID=A0A814VGK4_9BILA|nr:unnamed protein product [Didymodactylos carnosus]CAF3951030.1 unnamed protein product [Didymodactylos carnosus]